MPPPAHRWGLGQHMYFQRRLHHRRAAALSPPDLHVPPAVVRAYFTCLLHCGHWGLSRFNRGCVGAACLGHASVLGRGRHGFRSPVCDRYSQCQRTIQQHSRLAAPPRHHHALPTATQLHGRYVQSLAGRAHTMAAIAHLRSPVPVGGRVSYCAVRTSPDSLKLCR